MPLPLGDPEDAVGSLADVEGVLAVFLGTAEVHTLRVALSVFASLWQRALTSSINWISSSLVSKVAGGVCGGGTAGVFGA